ncbi:MAG: hypothetical protein NZL93_03685 [Chthoniobacterales bacterium]|nr:hypothetical protein [Chthoniobacterales bacterium]
MMDDIFDGIISYLESDLGERQFRLKTLMQYMILADIRGDAQEYTVDDLARAYIVIAYILNQILFRQGKTQEELDLVSMKLLHFLMDELKSNEIYEKVAKIVEKIPAP